VSKNKMGLWDWFQRVTGRYAIAQTPQSTDVRSLLERLKALSQKVPSGSVVTQNPDESNWVEYLKDRIGSVVKWTNPAAAIYDWAEGGGTFGHGSGPGDFLPNTTHLLIYLGIGLAGVLVLNKIIDKVA
jgi:hypothetical protein